jgi:hypothetical protein
MPKQSTLWSYMLSEHTFVYNSSDSPCEIYTPVLLTFIMQDDNIISFTGERFHVVNFPRHVKKSLCPN